MKKTISVLSVLLLIFLSVFSFACCAKKETPDADATLKAWQETYTAGAFGIRSKKNPFVQFTFDTEETVRVELYPSVAPISVENFLTYVEEGFYEGTAFHRIMEGQMIQGGGFEIKDNLYVHKDPTRPAIKGEFASNGVNNTLRHTRGVISMARTKAKDSATSQFFFCAGTVPSWDGEYAAFGRVIDEESMSVLSRLEKLTTHAEPLYYGAEGSSSSDVPVTRLTIKSVLLIWNQ